MIRKNIKEFVVEPFYEFVKKESSSSILMLSAMLLALFFANSPFSDWYYNLWQLKTGFTFGNFNLYKPLILWINDGLMAIFFFVVGLEIKREILIGELSDVKGAAFPIIAAIGGAVVPALIYFIINFKNGNLSGWGIPMATDIAFAVGVVSLLGSRVPIQLKIFITSLAVVDDIIAILVIAIFYSDSIKTNYLIMVIITLILLFVINRLKIKSILTYIFIGIILWYFFLKSGIHATIAGVILALFIPSEPKIPLKNFLKIINKLTDQLQNCPNNPDSEIPTKCQKNIFNKILYVSVSTYNPMSRLEHNLHSFSAFVIMPIFAFANAGVKINFSEISLLISPVSLGIILGLVLGKPVGIFSIVTIFRKLKVLTIPKELKNLHILGAGLLAGIGLTMSIFISTMAFSDTDLETAKLAILTASSIAGVSGYLFLIKTQT